MKRIAKLALFFCNSFILLFLFSAVFYFLGLWVDSVRMAAVRIDHTVNLFKSLRWALSFSFYIAILLSTTYAARKKVPLFASILLIFILSCVFTFGVFLGIGQLEKLDFYLELGQPVKNEPGLILSRGVSTTVVLSGDGLGGPRVLSMPGQDLLYQGEEWGPVSSTLAPSLPFSDEKPWVIQSMFIDFSLNALHLNLRYGESLFSFLIYGGSIILFLCSLRFLLGISSWPLANLFIGALAFRGILAFEAFLNTGETQNLISAFLGGRLPEYMISPLIFACLGSLILLYTFLSYLAWGKKRRNNDQAE